MKIEPEYENYHSIIHMLEGAIERLKTDKSQYSHALLLCLNDEDGFDVWQIGGSNNVDDWSCSKGVAMLECGKCQLLQIMTYIPESDGTNIIKGKDDE